MENHVRRLYAAFEDHQLAAKAAELVYPVRTGWKGQLRIIFQTIPDLHQALPNSMGDWYFTGNYPTSGGLAVLNRSFINFWEKREGRSY
jgi:amidophosphoribosyltransferase